MRKYRRYIKDASFFPLSLYETVELNHLSAVVRRLDERNAIPATSGNFSIRTKDNSFLISKSGMHKRDLNPSCFVRVFLDNTNVNDFLPKPSDEMLLHKVIYHNNQNVRAVLHCHAPELENIILKETKKNVLSFFTIPGHELLKALGKNTHLDDFLLPVFKNDQNMTALATKVEKIFLSSESEPCAFVLEKHGIYCFGNSVAQAEKRLEALLYLIPQTVLFLGV